MPASFIECLEDVVVLDHVRVRDEVRVPLGGRLLVGVAEQEELELRADVDQEALRCGALDLPLEDPAGRHLDRFAGLLVDEVAHHEGRALDPGDAAQGGEVREHPEVAVALLPVRVVVAGERGHVDVEGEQVVAGLERAAGREHLVHEVLPDHALAHEPPLEVGEHDEDGVDRTVGHGGADLVGGEHALGHRVSSCGVVIDARVTRG